LKKINHERSREKHERREDYYPQMNRIKIDKKIYYHRFKRRVKVSDTNQIFLESTNSYVPEIMSPSYYVINIFQHRPHYFIGKI